MGPSDLSNGLSICVLTTTHIVDHVTGKTSPIIATIKDNTDKLN